MQKLHNNQYHRLTYYVLVGSILNLPKSKWPKPVRYSFYTYCFKNYTVKRCTVDHYFQVSKYLTTYPKFKSTGLCFSELRNNLSKLEQHLGLAEFKTLTEEECLSPAYWKKDPQPID